MRGASELCRAWGRGDNRCLGPGVTGVEMQGPGWACWGDRACRANTCSPPPVIGASQSPFIFRLCMPPGVGWRADGEGSPHPTALGSALTLLLPLSLQCTVQVKLELGHRAQLRKKPTTEGFTHDWMVFVRGPEQCEIQHFVEKVVFRLHDSFPKPKRGECPLPWGAAGLNSLASAALPPHGGAPHPPFPLSCELGCQESPVEVVMSVLCHY